MKKIFYTIFSLFIYTLACAGVAFADDCPTNPADETTCTNVTGCVYDQVSDLYYCHPCSTGFYRTKNSENKYVCTDCTKRPDGAEWTGNGGDSDNCPWEITCLEKTQWNADTSTCETCPSEETAMPVVVSFDGTNTSFTVNGGDVQTPPKCLPKKVACNDETYFQLICADGNVDSDEYALWDDNINNYDFSTCHCRIQSEILYESLTVGRLESVCAYTQDGSSATDDCQYVIEECYSGYCSTGINDINYGCQPIPPGYYSIGKEVLCKKCPVGATSDGEYDATTRNACYYTEDTKFKDINGTFSIPASKAKIEWNWMSQ